MPKPRMPIPGGAYSRDTGSPGYFREEHRKQGGYANGGLMPWVGGELCLGAFQCGRESYGVDLLRQYADHLRRTGGTHVCIGRTASRGSARTNEVNYAGWGMRSGPVRCSKGWPGCATWPLACAPCKSVALGGCRGEAGPRFRGLSSDRRLFLLFLAER